MIGLPDVVHVQGDTLEYVISDGGGKLVEQTGRRQYAEEDVVSDDDVEVLQPVGAAKLPNQVVVGNAYSW